MTDSSLFQCICKNIIWWTISFWPQI